MASTPMGRTVRQLASTGRMSSLAVPVLEDAADHIDRLTAQRDALLAALKDIARAFDLAIFKGHINGGTENSRIATAASEAIANAEASR